MSAKHNSTQRQRHVKVLVVQSCPTLCNPMDSSPPGSSVLEILQARILEWVVRPSSRQTLVLKHFFLSIVEVVLTTCVKFDNINILLFLN